MSQLNPHHGLQLSMPPRSRSSFPPQPPSLQQVHNNPYSPIADHLIDSFHAFVPYNHTPGRGSFPQPPPPQHLPQAYSQGHPLLHHTRISQAPAQRSMTTTAPPPTSHPLQHSPQPPPHSHQPHCHYWHPDLPVINRTSSMTFSAQPLTLQHHLHHPRARTTHQGRKS